MIGHDKQVPLTIYEAEWCLEGLALVCVGKQGKSSISLTGSHGGRVFFLAKLFLITQNGGVCVGGGVFNHDSFLGVQVSVSYYNK